MLNLNRFDFADPALELSIASLQKSNIQQSDAKAILLLRLWEQISDGDKRELYELLAPDFAKLSASHISLNHGALTATTTRKVAGNVANLDPYHFMDFIQLATQLHNSRYTATRVAFEASVCQLDSNRPSVAIISIPKSGTVYLNNLICKSFGLISKNITNAYFPRDNFDVALTDEFSRGGFFNSSHADSSDLNLQILDEFGMKFVVHLRDPRSVLISWVNHIRKLYSKNKELDLLKVCPKPPLNILSGSFDNALEWHIDEFYPAVCDWMDKWLDAEKGREGRILITDYDSLRQNEGKLIETIANFYGMSKEDYKLAKIEKTEKTHYRNGKPDEWRLLLSDSQLQNLNRQISPKLWSKLKLNT